MLLKAVDFPDQGGDLGVIVRGFVDVLPNGFLLLIKQPGAALDINILGLHGFHNKLFLAFLLWNEAFDFPRDKCSSCHGEEFRFTQGFQVQTFVSGPARITVDGKRERAEQVDELVDVLSL